MKTHHVSSSIACASWAVFALSVAAVTPVQGQTTTGSQVTLQVANAAELQRFSLDELTNKPLRGSNQEELGTISDFLIDPQSGRVEFAVVPSGAGESGETYRLVPLAALQSTSGTEEFSVSLDQAKWRTIGTLAEQRLQGSITLDSALRQRLAQQFAVSADAAASAGTEATSLVRASQIKGQSLRSGADQLGTIEDVLIDIPHRAATAILKPEGALAASNQNILVPFQRLQFSKEPQAGITTTLTQSELQQAQSNLTPTGRTTGPFGQPVAAGHQTVAAVQQALQGNPTLAQANVHVVPETRIALRGTVESEQIKSAAERIAKETAPGVQVDNQITVQPK